MADQAARLYREGNPHVMKIVGHTDATGDELHNPAGETDLVAPDVKGPDPRDRRAVVTWR